MVSTYLSGDQIMVPALPLLSRRETDLTPVSSDSDAALNRSHVRDPDIMNPMTPAPILLTPQLFLSPFCGSLSRFYLERCNAAFGSTHLPYS